MLKGISVLPKGRFQKVTLSIEQQYTVTLTTLVEELQCFSIISRVVYIILKLKKKTPPPGEKSDLSKGLDWYLSRCQIQQFLQGLVDLMVFLQQHVQESSCMLDMDMAASIHWMLLEVSDSKRRILWFGTREMFGKVLVWGWMCRPCWCCNISYLCGIFCGIEECVKSSSEMFQVTSQSLLSDSKFRWESEKLFCFYFVCLRVYTYIPLCWLHTTCLCNTVISTSISTFGCMVYMIFRPKFCCTSICNSPTKRTHLLLILIKHPFCFEEKKSPRPCRHPQPPHVLPSNRHHWIHPWKVGFKRSKSGIRREVVVPLFSKVGVSKNRGVSPKMDGL